VSALSPPWNPNMVGLRESEQPKFHIFWEIIRALFGELSS
jgi:hypothetical protein